MNRKFGMAIFAPNKAFERRSYPPGQHGPRLRRKMSDYSLGLNEKQKLRYMYGLTEKQFRLTFDRAKKMKGVTGDIFLQMLETRLDNVVYRAGLARSRQAARQFVTHGHIRVNGHKVDIASYQVSAGDEIEVRDRSSSRQLGTRNLEDNQYRPIPPWLTLNGDSLKVVVSRLPNRDEADTTINEQLIVEFYSR
jgi:small subunit ribosomal protein S4